MKTIVAAFHPSSPSELHQGLLHRQDIRLFMVHSLPELIDRLGKGADLCLIGPQLADCGAATASQALRNLRRSHPIPLILIHTGTAHAVALPPGLFDEVIEWPAQQAMLPFLLARYLGVPARSSERLPLKLHIYLGTANAASSSPDAFLGSSIDISLDGLLLRTNRAVSVGDRLGIRFTLPSRPQAIGVTGRIIRLDTRTHAPDAAVALLFESPPDEVRMALQEFFKSASGRACRWKIIRDGQRQIVKLSGVLSAEVDLSPLKQLRGEIDFNLREFRRISSDSIQAWLDLIRSLRGASKIRLLECPIQFVQQAGAISNLLDNTEVVSFFAPYVCSRCGLDEEQLIDVRRDMYNIQGVLERKPPTFGCVRCGTPMTFDDIPERYFMFL